MKGICSACDKTDVRIDMHHINYKDDITIPLCRSCHKKLHYDLCNKGTPLNPPIRLVRISMETHARLSAIGRKGETFNHIVERILDSYEVRK